MKYYSYRLILHFLSIIILLFPFLPHKTRASSNNVTIRVESQRDFDVLSETLLRHLTKADIDIEVDFVKGHYYYKHKHVNFSGKSFPKASISFTGNGSTIISAGKDLKMGEKAVMNLEGAGYIDDNGNDFQNYSHLYQSDSIVEILNERSKLCRIHCFELNEFDKVDCTNVYIRLTSWYTSFLYHVNSIKEGYVYFTADNLALGLSHYGNYNVNYDYTVGKVLPRFRLINFQDGDNSIISTPKGLINRYSDRVIHRCEAGFLFSFSNCKFKQITIEGFNIIGCNSDSQVIRFNNVQASPIIIKNNKFSSARGYAILGSKTDNISVDHCEFHDNYIDVIVVSNTCANIKITNNKFYNNGKGLKNSFCILCRGTNYTISKNEICDFNYGAIGVGVWHNSAKGSKPSYGIVERNHIYYTPSYLKDKASWTLIDSGAIYLWSKNDGAVIRNNFIHDYEGMGSNRGIYCDDGTNNCSIYGNIILNISNSYSIDLRRSLTLDKHNIGLKSNVNNYIYGNYFNNRFRFQGRKDDSSSISGGNTILVDDENNMPRMIKENLIEKSKDNFVKGDLQKWYKKGLRLVR